MFTTPGDIFGRHSAGERGAGRHCRGVQQVETKDAGKHFTTHRTIPTTVTFPKTPVELRMGNPTTERPFKPGFEHTEEMNFPPLIR